MKTPNRVALAVLHPRGRRWAARLERSARRFLGRLSLSGVELSLALVDDRAIRRLNRAWRSKDRPTDVLSFPAAAAPRGAPGPRPLGDVIISHDTAARRARGPAALAGELDLYLAHGLLHLLGHDHHRRAEARKMAAEEARLLGHAGMVGGLTDRGQPAKTLFSKEDP